VQNVGEEFRHSFFTSLIDEEAIKEGKVGIRVEKIREVLGPIGRRFPIDYEFCATFTHIQLFLLLVEA
jgi:hypothetical protein